MKLEIENELVTAITTQRSSECPTAKAKGEQRNMAVYVVLIYGKRNLFWRNKPFPGTKFNEKLITWMLMKGRVYNCRFSDN